MTIRITWLRAILTLVLLGAAGMLFAWSGVMNLAASSGHWKITDWFLHWAMRSSVPPSPRPTTRPTRAASSARRAISPIPARSATVRPA